MNSTFAEGWDLSKMSLLYRTLEHCAYTSSLQPVLLVSLIDKFMCSVVPSVLPPSQLPFYVFALLLMFPLFVKGLKVMFHFLRK